MWSRYVTWMLVTCLLSANSYAEMGLLSTQMDNSVMKKLLGHWQITDQTKDAQGQWQTGTGASWHFYTILNGHAVQDDWIAPALDQPEPITGRQYGSNIRIFNPKKNQWEMVWVSVKGQKVDTFTAVEQDQKIIMSGQFNGQTSRITFFDIKSNTFAWKLEFKQADNTWLEVYRIQGKRSVKST